MEIKGKTAPVTLVGAWQRRGNREGVPFEYKASASNGSFRLSVEMGDSRGHKVVVWLTLDDLLAWIPEVLNTLGRRPPAEAESKILEWIPQVLDRCMSVAATRAEQSQKDLARDAFKKFGLEIPEYLSGNSDDGTLNLDALLVMKVEELELSERSSKCLTENDISHVGDLVQKKEAEMLRIPNLGRKSLNEIKEVLTGMGLRLGLEVEGWPPEEILLERLKQVIR